MSPSAPIPVTETPALPTAPALFQEWSAYLKPEDLSQIQAAYHFSESAHEGQFRKSGEPYIAHPLAVASIPLFLGLIVVMPVLGHATWHIYRAAVA